MKSRIHRLLTLQVMLVVAAGALLTVAASGQQPSNPLRKTAPVAVASGPAESESARQPTPAEVMTTPSASELVRAVEYREEAPLASTSIITEFGGPVPIELGPGEFIVEDGKPVPGDLFFEGPAGGDCCGGGGCARCCLIPCPVLSLDDFEFFSGVHGFTGPKNRGQSGSFGFHGGFNWGAPFPCLGGCLGAQIGVNAAFSNFSGGSFTDQDRNQIFVTGGLFRRVDWGLQGGLVLDYLSDRWYTDTDLTQLRGEVSWMFPCSHELGFWFTTSNNEDTQLSNFSGQAQAVLETWRSTDLYAFFYRHRFADGNGASARLYAGFTGDSDGLIGGDLRLPLNQSFALTGGFTYLIPDEAATGAVGGGHEFESWNLAISLVWYPGCRNAFGNDYYRPLFDVADNGSFMVNRQF